MLELFSILLLLIFTALSAYLPYTVRHVPALSVTVRAQRALCKPLGGATSPPGRPCGRSGHPPATGSAKTWHLTRRGEAVRLMSVIEAKNRQNESSAIERRAKPSHVMETNKLWRRPLFPRTHGFHHLLPRVFIYQALRCQRRLQNPPKRTACEYHSKHDGQNRFEGVEGA